MDRLFPSRAVLFPTRIVLAASLVFLGSPHPNARPVPLTGGRLTATTMACDDDGCRSASSAPPDTQGYFHLLPVGSWSSLPSGKRCKDLVHYSKWEPRPENADHNSTIPDKVAVDESFQKRPRSNEWVNWNSWLLPRLDGNFIGTTDEILQWAACKWGLSDNFVRAIAAAESTWYQYLTYPNDRCVTYFGCGDFWASDPTYCDGIAKFGHDYQKDYGQGVCPGTFSIAGVMSYQSPDWGKWRGNQNGTFPFNRNSTAFAVEYMAASMRGCYEGWLQWLKHSYPDYKAGDIWGCAGEWYWGGWHTQQAEDYISTVKGLLEDRIWLQPAWMEKQYKCDKQYGCPH